MRNRKSDVGVPRSLEMRARLVEDRPRTRLQRLIVDATMNATPTLSEYAESMGIADITLSLWRGGRRVPRPAKLLDLARALEERARSINREAARLRAAADELATEEGREQLLRRELGDPLPSVPPLHHLQKLHTAVVADVTVAVWRETGKARLLLEYSHARREAPAAMTWASAGTTSEAMAVALADSGARHLARMHQATGNDASG
jgi:transcriptional regulator with XRE-family HTH domain